MKKNELTIIRIGLLGDSSVGKSAIVNTFFGNEFGGDLLATIGSDKSEKPLKLKNKENIRLIIWDASGAERMKSVVMNTMKAVKGILLTFDVTRRESFDNLNSWLELIKDNLENPLIVLFGNKVDIEKDKWKVTSEEACILAKEKGFAYFECSAKTGQGINEGLSYIANLIYCKMKGIDEKNIIININDLMEKPNKDSNCPGNKKSKNNKK